MKHPSNNWNQFSESKDIVIEGAKENNLKNVSVRIPRGKLVVITGISGSGKSSLAFDTIYAEGQRRYMDSFSVYARIRVQGSIIDAMRKKDWVPRSVRKRAKNYNEAIVYLTQKYERPPTKEELCI